MKIKEIYFAGGCFWGLEHYLKKIDGVVETVVGYANGITENPTYEDICYKSTGHAEAVKVKYDNSSITLQFLLEVFFDVIDPTLLNRQGNDVGIQYRTGVYYKDNEDYPIIRDFFKTISEKFNNNVKTELSELKNFFVAEEYHQDYLTKNPDGYCHISLKKIEMAKNIVVDPYFYEIKKNKKLTKIQEDIAFNGFTETPYSSIYYDFDEEGIYVDIVSGEPLFISSDKFLCSCGWPSFYKTIDPYVVRYNKDSSHGMNRIEVRSRVSDIH